MAALWFWLFQLVMVLILLNMLLAIIMDAYTYEKAKAGAAETLVAQAKKIYNRSQSSKKGERVRLNDIIDGYERLIDIEYEGEKHRLYDDKRPLHVEHVKEHVPEIKEEQANRLLCKAKQSDIDSKAGENPTPEEIAESIKQTLKHLEQNEQKIKADVDYCWRVVRDYDLLDPSGDL